MARARLGDSKGTLYNYLKNKEELFDAQVRIWGARGSKMGMP
jgi:AcrR family transcriptional regulator